jgi:hypothetical protein
VSELDLVGDYFDDSAGGGESEATPDPQSAEKDLVAEYFPPAPADDYADDESLVADYEDALADAPDFADYDEPYVSPEEYGQMLAADPNAPVPREVLEDLVDAAFREEQGRLAGTVQHNRDLAAAQASIHERLDLAEEDAFRKGESIGYALIEEACQRERVPLGRGIDRESVMAVADELYEQQERQWRQEGYSQEDIMNVRESTARAAINEAARLAAQASIHWNALNMSGLGVSR